MDTDEQEFSPRSSVWQWIPWLACAVLIIVFCWFFAVKISFPLIQKDAYLQLASSIGGVLLSLLGLICLLKGTYDLLEKSTRLEDTDIMRREIAPRNASHLAVLETVERDMRAGLPTLKLPIFWILIGFVLLSIGAYLCKNFVE